MITEIKNKEDLAIFDKEKTNVIFFYGSYSENSIKELEIIKTLPHQEELSEITAYTVDTGAIKDIHKLYNISSVPATVILEKEKAPRVINGMHTIDQYIKIITNTLQSVETSEENKKVADVKVYSTPTCTYCTLLKNYLKENKIPFKDIDISKDSTAANKLVAKTGQTGVPQAFINGTHIMGFDKVKINNLLKIKN